MKVVLVGVVLATLLHLISPCEDICIATSLLFGAWAVMHNSNKELRENAEQLAELRRLGVAPRR